MSKWSDKRIYGSRPQFCHYLIRAIWSTCVSPPPCHTKERGDLAELPTLQSLAHDLPKFITTLLFILLKILQGIWKFSTRIHPNNLYIHLLTSGPGRVLITGLTHKNKSPRIKKNACLDYHTSKHTDVDEI